MQQEPILFSGTVKENICYGLDIEEIGKEKLTEMLDEACKKANAYDFMHNKD